MDSSSPEKIERLYDYHKHNLVYIGDYIKFADTKAGVAISANLILLGFFGNIVRENNYTETSLSEFFLIIGVLFLALASFFFGIVVWPRYSINKEYCMSWAGITAFENDEEYTTLIHNQTNEEFLEGMAKQNRALANICVKKYKYLRTGLIIFMIGIIISLLSWVFS
ncbi:Pycsar system effector family protein [Planococcus salinus]|uniref:Pycsar effector protein domain-containing protein n=1 Tax=Planococcus salinus TaxID=1848460 RepID=A0A3M8P6P7_9BACL|nr:Pycsar system effector family protein [Planococcus salinus]RNF38874.1 hypothetical protein EEX84_12200 [Planococcus salinus]